MRVTERIGYTDGIVGRTSWIGCFSYFQAIVLSILDAFPIAQSFRLHVQTSRVHEGEQNQGRNYNEAEEAVVFFGPYE